MKKLIIGFLLFILGIGSSFAQKRDIVEYQQNWDKQRLFWGYYLGINMKTYEISYKNNTKEFIDINPSLGFNVGLIGDLRLHKNISLRLEPGLSSNTKDLDFTYIEGGAKDSIRKVNATYLRIPLLLKFSTDRYNNIRPYAIGGVSYDYNFSSNQDNPEDNEGGEFRMKTSNFMYEFGFGIDIYLPYFVFSPSIRGVFAINNELVYDDDPNSQWTGNIDYLGTRGIFLKLAFH
jgi:hypothetical protein